MLVDGRRYICFTRVTANFQRGSPNVPPAGTFHLTCSQAFSRYRERLAQAEGVTGGHDLTFAHVAIQQVHGGPVYTRRAAMPIHVFPFLPYPATRGRVLEGCSTGFKKFWRASGTWYGAGRAP